jgi:hypothetical protein
MKKRYLGGLVLVLLSAFARPVSAQQCLTIVTVDTTGKLSPTPSTLPCHPEDRVLWVVVNNYTENVKVLFDNFQIRGTTTAAAPLGASSHSMTVTKGDVEVSKGVKVKKNGDFGGTTLPWGGFKYAITLTQVGGSNPQLDYLDPDLDVTPPPTVVPPQGRGRGRGGRGGR